MPEPVILTAVFIDGFRHTVGNWNLVVECDYFLCTFNDPSQNAFTSVFIQILAIILDVGIAFNLGTKRNDNKPAPDTIIRC